MRIRLSSTVVHVEHDGEAGKADTVSIAYSKKGKLYRIKARSVVMAGGCWTTKHIVKDLPQSPAPSLCAVLPLSLHDGERCCQKLAVSVQNGNERLPLV